MRGGHRGRGEGERTWVLPSPVPTGSDSHSVASFSPGSMYSTGHLPFSFHFLYRVSTPAQGPLGSFIPHCNSSVGFRQFPSVGGVAQLPEAWLYSGWKSKAAEPRVPPLDQGWGQL